MTEFRWTVGSLLLLVGLFMSFANCSGAFAFYRMPELERQKVREGFHVPFLAGFLIMAGMLLVPVPSVHRWCWVGFLIDYDSVPGHLIGFYRLLRNRVRRKAG
jgi:hypothetical protein